DSLQPAAGDVERQAGAPAKGVERRPAVSTIQSGANRAIPRLSIVRGINDVRIPVLVPQECRRSESKTAAPVSIEPNVRQSRCDTPRRELSEECRVSDLLHLVDRYVEWNSIVVHTPTAEDRGAAGLINRVREAESRLECFLKGVTVIAGGDVTIEIERHQQVA